MKKIPKSWLLITLYMIFVFLLGLAGMYWAKQHPIIDEHSEAVIEQAAPEQQIMQ